MTAYYNEHDKKTAQWLRELIKDGHIAPGEVDERSIEDVIPTELTGFAQCHFFAGIGVWSYALRQAGWPDDRQVWTGSCPCQPFSAAGKGEGIADERHLWPAFFHLIEQCKPRTIFGEQVSSKDGLTWLDIVSSDLEGAGYTIGASDICAAGVGAPHIRQRLYFVADTESARRRIRNADDIRQADGEINASGDDNKAIQLADSASRNPGTEREQRGGEYGLQPEGCGIDELADPELQRQCGHQPRRVFSEISKAGNDQPLSITGPGGVGYTNGFWHDAEWLYCRDEKYRPTKPGIFPLANGTAGRVALLRGAGNAVVSEAAKEWIRTYLELTSGAS